MLITLAGYANGKHKNAPDAWSKPTSFHESVTAQLDELSLLRTARVLTRQCDRPFGRIVIAGPE
ncbi:hypothetical protein [Burkholderia ambifaria]|jgi:protein-tyrosine phosphatase|uniref:hypothetical protein n=1 Tax=Burkholderia ambifaria TaxID=152480 RepID=UPI00158EAE05|nr:hypothetical protein [Burkholderia ambifaria]